MGSSLLPLRHRISRVVRSVRFYGRRHRCPLCDASLRRFLPGGEEAPVLRELEVVGAGPRERFACPRCFSMDRERLLHLYLDRRTDLLSGGLEGAAVLHVAPEGGLRRVLERSGARYVTVDLQMDSVTARMDLRALAFPDSTFALVVCNHVLEHVPDDRRAMGELLRVLAPGGIAILQVPLSRRIPETIEDPSVSDPAERERRFGQHDHVRIYGPDYIDRLREAGFEVEAFSFPEEYGPEEAERFGLLPGEVLFVGRRR